MNHLKRLKQKELSAVFTLLMLWLGAAPTYAEDPAVYFYTAGSVLNTTLPVSKHGFFAGSIYDGQQRLGFIWRNHYLAVRLTPGLHVFSASLSGKHPAENSQTSLLLEPDKTYFVRAQLESKGFIVGSVKGRLDQVTCSTARDEAEDPRLVEDKHVAPEIWGKVIRATTWPPCQ